jgi:hypothetical protein
VDRWHDVESDREVWVIAMPSVADWPAKTPWACANFGLFVALERVVDVTPLAEAASSQGLAVAFAWGPGCAIVEDAFDDAIAEQALVTSSHADESLEEALELFFAIEPPRECSAWCIAAFGTLEKRVTRALERRGAKRRS